MVHQRAVLGVHVHEEAGLGCRAQHGYKVVTTEAQPGPGHEDFQAGDAQLDQFR